MSVPGSPYQGKPDAYAAATIAGAALTNVGGKMAKLARTGLGVFTFTLDGQLPLDTSHYVAIPYYGAASTTAGPAAWLVADTSDTIKTFTFKDLLNAACDVTFLTVVAWYLPFP